MRGSTAARIYSCLEQVMTTAFRRESLYSLFCFSYCLYCFVSILYLKTICFPFRVFCFAFLLSNRFASAVVTGTAVYFLPRVLVKLLPGCYEYRVGRLFGSPICTFLCTSLFARSAYSSKVAYGPVTVLSLKGFTSLSFLCFPWHGLWLANSGF